MMSFWHLVSVLCIVVVTSGSPQWGNNQQQNNNDNCCEEYCYSHDTSQYLMFGTKTAYEFIYGKNFKHHRVPYCTPVQYWSANRHGTRLPNREKIINFSTQLPRLKQEIISNYRDRKSYPQRGRLCQADLDNLEAWNWNGSIHVDIALHLTQQGRDDLFYLAKRYQSRFPNLLSSTSNPERDFKFQYTDTQRTEESYRAFINGLFGASSYSIRGQVMDANSSAIIKPYENCGAWQDRTNGDEINKEMEAFTKTADYQQMVKDVSTRLGFKYPLNATSVELMYEMCSFDKAWRVEKLSPWCAAFTKNHLKILEYRSDLKYYYRSGYGNDMSAKLGCTAVKDMYEQFQKVANGEPDQYKAVSYFSHATMVLDLLVALGVAKDPYAITADNFHSASKRNWQTSNLAPFASNLAAVFYKCDRDEKKVMFFLNEKAIDINEDFCSVGLCNWENLESYLKQISSECSLNFCTGGSPKISTVSGIVLSIMFTLIAKLITV